LKSFEEVQAAAVGEAQKLFLLRHPFVTYVHDTFEYRDTFYIITERCDDSITYLFSGTFRPPLCTIGFSMGNAVMLDAYTEFHPAPTCMIVGGAFSSARDGAVHAWGIPGWMAHALPDQWNNVVAISRSHPPLLVLHSDADQANPLWMGERIYQAAPQPKQLVILHGLRHNAAFKGPIEQWWAPAITFIAEGGTAP